MPLLTLIISIVYFLSLTCILQFLLFTNFPVIFSWVPIIPDNIWLSVKWSSLCPSIVSKQGEWQKGQHFVHPNAIFIIYWTIFYVSFLIYITYTSLSISSISFYNSNKSSFNLFFIYTLIFISLNYSIYSIIFFVS